MLLSDEMRRAGLRPGAVICYLLQNSISIFYRAMERPKYPKPFLDRIHESCHAVVAWHLGLPGPDFFEFAPHPMVMQDFPDGTSPEKEIMTFMAGIVVDEIFDPAQLGIIRVALPQQDGEVERESDRDAVQRLLCRFRSTERDDVRERLMQKTREIVVLRTDAIVELARTMLGKDMVDGAEAKRVYRQLVSK